MVTLTQSYVVCVLKDFISLSPSDASLYAADIWLESLRWVQVSFTSASQAVGRVSAGSDLLKEERRCISSCQMRTWIQDMLYKQGCFELNANSSMLTCWCSAGVMLLSVPDTWCADSALPLRVLTHWISSSPHPQLSQLTVTCDRSLFCSLTVIRAQIWSDHRASWNQNSAFTTKQGRWSLLTCNHGNLLCFSLQEVWTHLPNITDLWPLKEPWATIRALRVPVTPSVCLQWVSTGSSVLHEAFRDLNEKTKERRSERSIEGHNWECDVQGLEWVWDFVELRGACGFNLSQYLQFTEQHETTSLWALTQCSCLVRDTMTLLRLFITPPLLSSPLLSSPLLSSPLLQSVSAPPPLCHSDEEEEEDLNKAFDVQGFQQILCPQTRSPPEKHRVYDEQDYEGEETTPGFLRWLKNFRMLVLEGQRFWGSFHDL